MSYQFEMKGKNIFNAAKTPTQPGAELGRKRVPVALLPPPFCAGELVVIFFYLKLKPYNLSNKNRNLKFCG